jgi:hypothetical protein
VIYFLPGKAECQGPEDLLHERKNMMKVLLLGFMLVLFTCSWVAAESSVWKAQKGANTLYLGGTCHILRETDYPLPPEFDRAYRASDVVVFETDLGRFQEPEAQQKLLASSLYTDGSTIENHLSPAAYKELTVYCEANGIPLLPLQGFKPSMLMTVLSLLELMKMGVTQRGVDLFYYEMAQKDKKGIVGLETVEEQIYFVSTMADGSENEFVSHSIKDLGTVRQQFDALAHAWRTGDAEKLNGIMNSDLKKRLPKLYKKLISDRNRNWLPTIEAFLKTPKTEFILVGAGHLVGPDGIVEVLKKKGYSVEKL